MNPHSRFSSASRRLWLSLGALAISLSITTSVSGQDSPPTEPPPAINAAGSPILPGSLPNEVWVTTQDFVALRRGPSRSFEQFMTVPPALTLPAYGRTSDTRWVQVEYQGERGWIAARYLVWTGDVINLRVDGVDPAPYIRRAAALATTTRLTPAYLDWVDPADQVTTIPAGVDVELTGRLGDDDGNYLQNFFRVQVRYEGQLYWVGSYNLNIFDGDYRRLLDLAYLFRYGRLYLGLEENVALAIASFRQIDDIWTRLSEGVSIACDPIPPLVDRGIATVDAASEPTFIPAITALQVAIDQTNSAITAFRDACANPSFTLTRPYIDTQIVALDEAYRNLILSGSFLNPLRVRNPLLREGDMP